MGFFVITSCGAGDEYGGSASVVLCDSTLDRCRIFGSLRNKILGKKKGCKSKWLQEQVAARASGCKSMWLQEQVAARAGGCKSRWLQEQVVARAGGCKSRWLQEQAEARESPVAQHPHPKRSSLADQRNISYPTHSTPARHSPLEGSIRSRAPGPVHCPYPKHA